MEQVGALVRELVETTDPAAREAAEAKLHLAEESEGDALASALVGLATAEGSLGPSQQMALVLLKRLLGKGGWGRLAKGTREAVEAALLQRLGSLGSLGAACLATIARHDFPEGATFVGQLLSYVASSEANDAPTVSGAFLCLEEFASGMSEDQLEAFAAAALPKLGVVFTKPSSYAGSDVLKAGKLLNSLANNIRMGSDFDLPKRALKPWLGTYVPAFLEILAQPWDPAHKDAVRAAIIALTAWTETLGHAVAKHHGPRLTSTLSALLDAVSAVHVLELESGGEAEDEEHSSSVEELLYEATDLLQTVVLSGEFALEGALGGLLSCLFRQCRVGPATAERWIHDVEAFVEEEEAEGVGSSLRAATKDLLADLLSESEEPALRVAFARAATAELRAASAKLQEGAPLWWLGLEAALALLALGAEQVSAIESAEREELTGLLASLPSALPDLHSAEPPFPLLRGQLLCLLARFGPSLQASAQRSLLTEARRCLQPEQAPILRACGVKAVHSLCDYVERGELPADLLVPAAPELLKEMATVVGGSSGEQTFYLLLPALAALLKAAPSARAGAESRVGPLAMALTLKFSGDPLIPAAAADVLKLLAREPSARAAVLSRVLPTARSVLANPDKMPVHLPAVCLNLLGAMVHGCGAPLPESFLTDIFPGVCALSLRSSEQDVLAAGRECLRAFLTVAPAQTLAWRGEDGSSAVAILVGVVLHLLGPESPQLSGSMVNRLLYVLLQCALEELRPFLDSILTAALVRMGESDLASVRQSLLTIFAYAVNFDTPSTLLFLSGRPAPAGPLPSALHFLVRDLEERLGAAVSSHDRKVCCLALRRLLDAGLSGDEASAPLRAADGGEALVVVLARLLVAEWRLHNPQLAGMADEEGEAIVPARSGGFDLQEALQSLAHDLGEAWSESSEDGDPEGEEKLPDPLKDLDTGALLTETLTKVLSHAELSTALLPTLTSVDKAALTKAALI